MIKEVIIVEGRDDEAVIKKAVDADVIQTHGYSYGKKLKERLKRIAKERGIIILTDPDYVGKRIRKDLASEIPEAKHAFLPRGKAIKGDDIGVENATPVDVKKAIEKAKPEYQNLVEEFTKQDMMKYGLTGRPNSSEIREKLAEVLGLEYGNAKHFLTKLNSFKVKRDDLEKALEEIEKWI